MQTNAKFVNLKFKKIMMVDAVLNQTNTYWELLKGLSSEVKLALINRLSSSLLAEKKQAEAKWADEFSGMWNDDPRSAEEIIDEIRSSRHL